MRAKDFLECMGNGKPIHQCEEDNDYIDDALHENQDVKLAKKEMEELKNEVD
jgi:hypothetical protein